MASTIVSLALALAAGATGRGEHAATTRTTATAAAAGSSPPGPGYGWGFPNGNPDGYGWCDHGDALPLGADRTAEYYFPRYFALPPDQMFLPTYYNPYMTRGQRYIAYAGCGGDHPAGGPADGLGR